MRRGEEVEAKEYEMGRDAKTHCLTGKWKQGLEAGMQEYVTFVLIIAVFFYWQTLFNCGYIMRSFIMNREYLFWMVPGFVVCRACRFEKHMNSLLYLDEKK